MVNSNAVYLGDSVYAEEGCYKGEVILTTDNGYPDDPRNRIAMGPNELNCLLEWLKQQGILKEKANDGS